MKEKPGGLQILKNWLKLAVLIGIIPWAMFYVTVIAPVVNRALGIDNLQYIKIGFYLIPIILPPLVLFSLLSRNDPD